MMGLDLAEVARRVLKYFVEGLVVAVAASYILGNKQPSMNQLVSLGLTAASLFALLDLMLPSSDMARFSRVGAGLALGSRVAGGF